MEASELALPQGTVLADRYLLGGMQEERDLFITYLSLDLHLEKQAAVVEFFPRPLTVRGNAGSSRDLFPMHKHYQELLQKFLSEARASAQIKDHPAVTGIRDIFTANNTAYYVTDYLESPSLRTYLKRKGGRIPPEELFPMAEPLFGALSVLHRTGRFLADLSPDAVRLENGSLRMPAFCWDEDWNSVNAVFEYSTTLSFSPFFPTERIAPGKRYGPWSDVYTLAALLTYCLVGVEPPNAVERIYGERPDFPAWPDVALTSRQEEALRKALCLKIQDRFQSAEEMHAALYGPPG